MNQILKNKSFQFLLLNAFLVLTLEILGIFSIHLPLIIEVPFFLIIIVFIGKNVLKGGLQGLFTLKFSNMYVLMTIAIIGAILIGEFEEAAVIVTLFAVSEKLEDLGIEHSQSAIEKLIENTPKRVTLKSGKQIDIEQAKIGDIFTVKPGEIIALDGKVLEGISSVDEATITGEPLPKEKVVGSTVYASTVNMQGYLEVEVLKEAKNSTVQRIVDLTSQATANKANYQKFIEKFSNYYTPIVFVLSILSVIIPTLIFGQDFRIWFERAITLLIIACPCALVISTPISIFSAVGNASTKGILIKGGRFLEELGAIKAIAFDKTRTLTFGKPMIEKIIPYQNATEEEILACAAGMESKSEHPMAHAVIEYAKAKGIEPHQVKNFHAITGKGIEADCLICAFGLHLLGNLDLILENNNHITEDMLAEIIKIQESGNTPLILADHGGVKGIIVVSDEIRPEANKLMQMLRALGIKPIILTGDNQKTANTVATVLSIDEVYGNLLPEGKVEKFQLLKDRYLRVAMVGDGVNDAPVLAISNVGIVMGAVGSDVAIESADIALMNDNIELIPFLVLLGRHTKKTIQFNILLAVITKVIALFLAGFGVIGLGIAIFADVGITTIVIVLSLKILSYNVALK